MITTSIQTKDKRFDFPGSGLLVGRDLKLEYSGTQEKPFGADGIFLEKLRDAARKLAAGRIAAANPLGRLDENARLLESHCRNLCRSALAGEGAAVADEWLLDNYYLLQEQIEAVRSDLSQTAFRRFRRFANREGIDLGPIYDLGRELVARLQGRLEPEAMHEFLGAYQSIRPLTQHELGALTNAIRAALVDFVCRVAVKSADSPGNPETSSIPQKNAISPSMIDPPAHVAVKNGILSIFSMESIDWNNFVRKENLTERILMRDPAGVYDHMDRFSRNHYLHLVGNLATRSGTTEERVARIAVELARRSAANGRDSLRGHVGYYLVGKGKTVLEEKIAYRSSWKEKVARAASRHPLSVYIGSIILVAVLGTSSAWSAIGSLEEIQKGGWIAGIMFVALAGLFSQFAVDIVDRLCAILVPPKPAMKMDFESGIPAEHRTLVAVPAMLSSEETVKKLIRQIEVRFAANDDDNLSFALLTDFPDAPQKTLPGEDAILAFARTEMRKLNERHCGHRPSRFFLLHRERKWNPAEGVWMGEERKRGKLANLNQLLLTGDASAFIAPLDGLDRLASVRYVIALDADTRLPRDAGRRLAGCIAHPLNRPLLDRANRRVVEGYAVVQPRIGTALPEANRSLFSRLLASDAGIDPYTSQTSNLYYDAFRQCSYIGKGIYDVRAFEAATADRFPDNRILSHDLIEGCFASCGYASDVELFEGVPFRFLASMNRQHRWIRGDWQIASWMLRKVPSARDVSPNPLSILSRWKIFDNLRRSMLSIFQLIFLSIACLLAPAHTLLWISVAVAIVSGPAIVFSLSGFLRKPKGNPWLLHLKRHFETWRRCLFAEIFSWCVLPFTAYSDFDAVARSLYRVCISRKKLLEWTVSSEVEARCDYGLGKHYRIMWPCALVGLATLAYFAAAHPQMFPYVMPISLAWLAGPAIAWWVSQPASEKPKELTNEEKKFLRRIARRTWHYFEINANGKRHGLPPDNVQQNLGNRIAAVTSPTNIGLGLLSALSALDLGYLNTSSFLNRTGRALESMRRLERYRGHFFNWNDIRDLRPMEPRYVSSIDSGNLWGSLVVLRAGLYELSEEPLVSPRLFAGLQDTLEAVEETIPSASAGGKHGRFGEILAEIRLVFGKTGSAGARQTRQSLGRIEGLAEDLIVCAPPHDAAADRWLKCFRRQCQSNLEELDRLAFWIRFPVAETILTDGDPRLEDLCSAVEEMDAHCTLRSLPESARRVCGIIDRILKPDKIDPNSRGRMGQKKVALLNFVRRAAKKAESAASFQLARISSFAELCGRFCKMDFRFLYHPQRRLLSIGFNASEGRLDEGYYDLLASESRLTSYLAVSHGQLPTEHWFALGRNVCLAGTEPVLLSWAGSMFEYLMPLLFMPSYSGTLLDASFRAAVQEQIRYARKRKIPWGISESSFGRIDEKGVYGYRAFGLSELSMRRDDESRQVVSPYASALALGIAPRESCANLKRLEELGCLGNCGFYDAIDYTGHNSLEENPDPCRIVMAHHSGMILLAITNSLLDHRTMRRFFADPHCESHDLLLQECIPQTIKPHRRQKGFAI